MQTNKLTLLIILFLLINCYSCGSTSEWKQRTIYQILTDRFAIGSGSKPGCDLGSRVYCGGNFKGIQNNLDYIIGMGFDAIWISPVVKNYPQGYHGYWAQDIYSINEQFGSPQDLKDLVNACHSKGIWVMVDIVANHMGNTDTDFSKNKPFDQTAHYHPFCNVNDCKFGDQKCLETCRLANLADLNHENSYVSQTLLSWIKSLVTTYGFDGLRIDTVPYVPKSFWTQFNQYSGVYQVGEVFNGDMGYVGGYVGPLSGMLNYPSYFRLKDVFLQNKDMTAIKQNYDDWKKVLSSIDMLGSFTDNHDNQRFLSYCGKGQTQCLSLYKSWTAFTLTSSGIPIIYYGTEQLFKGGNDPFNREIIWNNLNQGSEMYKFIATVNKARQAVKSFNNAQIEAYSSPQLYAFYRGQLFVTVTNVVNSQVKQSITNHPYQEGQTVCNIFYPKDDCLTIKNKILDIILNNGEVKIFIPKSTFNNDDIIDN